MPLTSDIENFLAILTAEGDICPSDNWICSLVRLQSMMDEALNTLHLTPAESFDKSSTQCELKMAEQRLRKWKTSIPEHGDTREWTLTSSLSFVPSY